MGICSVDSCGWSAEWKFQISFPSFPKDSSSCCSLKEVRFCPRQCIFVSSNAGLRHLCKMGEWRKWSWLAAEGTLASFTSSPDGKSNPHPPFFQVPLLPIKEKSLFSNSWLLCPVTSLIGPTQIMDSSQSIPLATMLCRVASPGSQAHLKAGLEIDISHEPLGLNLREEGSQEESWGCVPMKGCWTASTANVWTPELFCLCTQSPAPFKWPCSSRPSFSSFSSSWPKCLAVASYWTLLQRAVRCQAAWIWTPALRASSGAAVDRSLPSPQPHCPHLSSEKVEVEVSVASSCLTLWNSVDCSPLGSSVHGILQARMLE